MMMRDLVIGALFFIVGFTLFHMAMAWTTSLGL